MKHTDAEIEEAARRFEHLADNLDPAAPHQACSGPNLREDHARESWLVGRLWRREQRPATDAAGVGKWYVIWYYC